MNRVKGALRRIWTRARGLAKRRGGGGDKPKARGGGGVLWRLIPLGGALAASVVVFASLTSCEHGAYSLPLFRTSWCAPWSQAFGFMSTSAGVGFVVFLTLEVITVILAQMWRDRQLDRAERRADTAELRAEIIERGADAAELMVKLLELMEQSRREESERAERREEAAERREEAAARREEAIERREEAAAQREARLIELIESLKNGKDGGAK